VSSEHPRPSGLSLKTLLIAGAASAFAALVIPMVWRPGTVFAAAMTPIVVALVTELLRRPVDTVGAARARRTTPLEAPFDPLAPAPTEELEALPRRTTPAPAVHRRRPLTGRQWKLALATGLVAFAGAATVVTASELIAGDRVSGGGGSGRTTFFGGRSDAGEEATERRRERREQEEASPTPSATPDPSPTPTPTPSVTPTATPTPSPSPSPPAEAPEALPPAEPTPAP